MKKVIVALIAVVAFAGVACAKDELTLKGGAKFDHKMHKAKVGACNKCHGKDMPMKETGKVDKTNAACVACHKK